MKKIIIISLLLPTISLSQNTYTSIVVDSKNAPIQYANISVDKTNKGTYTNEHGIFSLTNISLTDTLNISCIGYERRVIAVRDIKDKIILTNNSINIDEVEINSIKKNKNFRVGYYHKKTLFSYTHGSTRNAKIATFISYQSPPALIEKILIPFTNINDTTRLKVYLYEVTKDGKPGKEIFSKLLISKEIKNKIDISDQRIRMPSDGIFVGVEWLIDAVIKDKNNIKKIVNSSFGLKMTNPTDSNFTYMYSKNQWRSLTVWVIENRNVRFGLELKPL